LRRRLWWAALVVVAGCGDVERGTAPPPSPLGATRSGTPAPPGSPVGALQPGVEQSKEALLAEVRKRQLTNEDFKEAASSRDPFRSFLTTFGTQVINVKPQHRILMEKYGLEELKLIAIVGGNGVPPRAMFADPSGVGWTVMRGDHVSKADALVTRVAPDRVFFQMKEDLGGGGKPKLTERVIELHANENIGQ
jgi:Tfp pilus assembly protein PilP